jgi:predicted transcriptional regulator
MATPGTIVTTSIKIDDQLKERVRKLAASQRRSAHSIMHEAIEQHVAREEARESLLNEALASWSEFQETGLHLSGDEVRQWLKTWGSEGAPDAPKCHGE